MTSAIGEEVETGKGSKIGQNYQCILLKNCQHTGGGGGVKNLEKLSTLVMDGPQSKKNLNLDPWTTATL